MLGDSSRTQTRFHHARIFPSPQCAENVPPPLLSLQNAKQCRLPPCTQSPMQLLAPEAQPPPRCSLLMHDEAPDKMTGLPRPTGMGGQGGEEKGTKKKKRLGRTKRASTRFRNVSALSGWEGGVCGGGKGGCWCRYELFSYCDPIIIISRKEKQKYCKKRNKNKRQKEAAQFASSSRTATARAREDDPPKCDHCLGPY